MIVFVVVIIIIIIITIIVVVVVVVVVVVLFGVCIGTDLQSNSRFSFLCLDCFNLGMLL